MRSLLALDYPEFEVIVVNDGSTDDTLEGSSPRSSSFPSRRLARGRPERARRALLPLGRRHAAARGGQANGGKADALNAGLNHSRYRYVCGVDADMVFAPDALTRAMREIAGDPEHVVGLTSYFENARDPARVLENGRQ